MKLNVLLLASTLVVEAVMLARPANVLGQESGHHTPVLLELFTSEGCSSCPPADKLLQKLDREQPVAGADLIVLSEHVDYWNHLGWADPYSSAQFSKRQQDYASLLDSEVYTPQLVIDGSRQVVGSDRASVDRAIKDSLRDPKTPVLVSSKTDAHGIDVHIEVGLIHGNRAATVYLALVADHAQSQVMRGENAGIRLEHVAVVQSLAKVGSVTNGSGFRTDVRLPLPPLLRAGNLRVTVLVQDADSRRIVGVAQDRL